MSKKTRPQFTGLQYKFWLAAAKERYGPNMLNWPLHIRKYHNSIEILKEVKIELVQASFPCGNTGVSEGVDKS